MTMMTNITLRLSKAGLTKTANWFNVRITSIHGSAMLNGKETQVDSTNDENDVLLETIGDKGIITLNRPKVLNSLNLSMAQKIYAALKDWENSQKLVIIKGTSQKAFCAGGDVKTIATDLAQNQDTLGKNFFRTEYTLNHLIATYKHPYIAILNGITMGGGVGLSVHGRYRIATENTLFAMPETAIGLVPDVGATYFLPRLQGKLGNYLGLTGQRLKGADVKLAGIATHYVQSERLGDLTKELLELKNGDVDEILRKYQPNNFNTDFTLKPYLKQIDYCFSAPTVGEIISRLESDGSEWAVKSLQLLEKMSPTALVSTLRAVEKGAQLSLAECLKMEFRLSCAALTRESDFYEGVRALLVDKDQKPVWKPSRLSEISEKDIAAKFEKVPAGGDLQL